MAMNKCPKCGSEAIDAGRILSAGAVAYKTDKQRHPFVRANLRTCVCLDCGYAESYVDADYREKIRKR